MKLSLFFALLIGSIATNVVASDQETQDHVCKMVTKAIVGKNDLTTDALKQTNGVSMPLRTKIPDAFVESGISGYGMDGTVGSYIEKDFYYAKRMLFFRNKATLDPNNPKEKPDSDMPEAGYYKLDRESLPESGLICPTAPSAYQHHWVGIESGDLLCVKRAHGNFYGVIHIEALCSSNTIVFSSVYKPEEVPADQSNVIFAPTTAPAQPSIAVPSQR